MSLPDQRTLKVGHPVDDVRHAVHKVCNLSGSSLSKRSGEQHSYKIRLPHRIFGYYDFDLFIEGSDGEDERTNIIISRRGTRSIFYDPMKLADRFIASLKAEIEKSDQ